MFAGGNNSISLTLKEEDDDDVINLCDFEFNLNLQDSLHDVEQIREFSKSISYVDDDDDQDSGRTRMWADDWFIVLDFVPFIDFYNFSLVCSSFSELLTFNRRYLVMKKILKDFPTLLQDSHHTKIESLRALMVERSPTDDPTFDKQLLSDVIHFLIEKKRYKQDIWKYISSERIRHMDQNVFITPFRPSMIKKTFYDFPDIPQVIRNDKSFILKFFNAYACSPKFFVFLKDSLKEDEEIAKKAVQSNGWFLTLLKKPTAEIVNLALQSKHRFSVSTSYPQFDESMFPKYADSLLKTPNCYALANEQSIVSDYRKVSRTTRQYSFFNSLILLDEKVPNNKNCEFLLQMAYFEQSPQLRSVLSYYNRAKGSTTYDLEDDFLTDLLCFPERFDYLSRVMTVHESLKCKTREITVSKIVKRVLEDDFTFNLTLVNKNMKLTSASIEYLRDRIINRKKVTATFAKLYFNKQIEPLFKCSEDEKLKFCNELATNRELNLKMLKYHPEFYKELSEESWKKDDEFMRVAMSDLRHNASYFDFSRDEMIVMAMSSNAKNTIRYLRKQPDWEARKQQLLQIFLDESRERIRAKWLTWPHVFQVAKAFLFFTNHQSDTSVFTDDDMLKMIEYIPPKNRQELFLRSRNIKLLEKVGMKNLIEIYGYDDPHLLLSAFKYCISYKNYMANDCALNGTLVKYQQSHKLLSNILKQTPKFVKALFAPRKSSNYYFSRKIPDVPFEMIKDLARENPRIIHYLPKPIQKKVSHIELH